MIFPISTAVAHTIDALSGGKTVGLPLPTPLPYGLVATSAAAVNQAKRRPEGQPAGIVLSDFQATVPFLAVNRETVEMIEWMCVAQQLNVFVPLAANAPSWMVQDRSQTHGTVGVMGSWLPELKEVLDAFGHLFISSANVTKQSVATTAPEVEEAFGGRLLVVDGDPLRRAHARHGSATIVRVSESGDLALARHGVNEEGYRGSSETYLQELKRRYAQYGAGCSVAWRSFQRGRDKVDRLRDRARQAS